MPGGTGTPTPKPTPKPTKSGQTRPPVGGAELMPGTLDGNESQQVAP